MNERNEERIIVKKAIKELAEVYKITGEKYENCDTWYDLSCLPLPESFIEKYFTMVNWYRISSYQKLSENFIEKYADKVDWIAICAYQKLSEGFIEKYAGEVDWHYVSIYQKLSDVTLEGSSKSN